MSNQFQLLTQRRFVPYFFAHALGVLNDNIFRYGLIVLVVYTSAIHTTIKLSLVANIIAGIFILPFFLFSAFAGQIADKFEKGSVIFWIKFVEFIVVCLFFIAFAIKNLWIILFVLFFLGLKTAFVGPVVYSYLPQQLDKSELTGGNAMVGIGTFGGILLGMLIGTSLATISGYGVWLITSTAWVFALIGWVSSFFIPLTPSPNTMLKLHYNIFLQIYQCFKFAFKDYSIFFGIIGVAWAWFYGLLITTQLPIYVKDHLGGDTTNIVLFLGVVAVGIVVGAVLTELLSRRKIELRLVILGTIGMTYAGLDLYFAHPGLIQSTSLMPIDEFIRVPANIRALIDFFILGAATVIYVVPLYSYVQYKSPIEYRARIIATYNIIRAFLLVLAAAYAIVLITLGFEITEIYILTALINLVITLLIYFSIRIFR